MTRPLPYTFFFVLLVLSADTASAQVKPGTPPLGSFGGGPDVINLANLNAHLEIPVVHKPGRGTNFDYDLTYDSSVWYPVTSGSTTSWQNVANWGWASKSAFNSGSSGYLIYYVSSATCYDALGFPVGTKYSYTGPDYYDSWGTLHQFGGQFDVIYGPCSDIPQNYYPSRAVDGSGLIAQWYDGPIITPGGGILNPPANPNGGAYNSTVTDRNGNKMTADTSGVFTDTLGRTALTISGANPVNFTYTAPSGVSASVRMNYTQYTVRTWFQAGIADYDRTSVSLVSSIVLPDNSQYSFTYEPTPAGAGCTPLAGTTACVTARIASVTLPTGGQILYSYSGGYGGIFSDGSTATLTRTTPDGMWTYVQVKGTGAASTTTITDPQSNQTVIQFQGIYETQRQVYQGSTAGTLLQTINTCYNGAAPPCTGTGVSSISRRTEIIQLGSSGPQCKRDYFYNGYSLQTQADDYDYGPSIGALIRRVLTTYAPLGNNIVDMPDTVTVLNGSLATVAYTKYFYDGTAPSAPPGTTPQWVNVSGSRGNATTIRTWKDASSYLDKTLTYFNTGNVQTATDVNGAVTTYVYSPDINATCGNAFPTSVNEPLSLSRSMTWNCGGGVQLTSTDENSKTTTTAYTDPSFWRPASVTDPLNNQTVLYYQPNATYPTPPALGSWLTFNNGTSVVSDIQYKDGLGRTYVDQRSQSPGSTTLDSVSYTFDSNGRPYSVSVPCAIGYAATCSTPKTTQAYDALNRVLQTTDGGGGWTAQSYSGNDVYTISGPAPGSNGGFEQGIGAWTLCGGGGAQLITDPLRAHSGNNYVQFSTSTGACIMGALIAVSPGDQVTFGGWAYRESGTTGYLAWKLVVYNSAQTAIAYPSPTPSNVLASSWTYQVGTYTIPPNGAYVQLYAELYVPTGPTVARVDDGFLVTPGGAGEQTKRKQLEYDALGRLTSVCEITNATGSGPCGQNVTQTGYWTTYSHDALGNLTGVTQNAQAAPAQRQTRAFSYDWLSRLTSETVPELGVTGNGTVNYTYDTDASCGTSSGDRVKRLDVAGNLTCYYYDALHRVTAIVTPSGPHTATTAGHKYFVYDSATVNGVAMTNAKTRLAEAYTAGCPTCAKITDVGFSYTARGETSDVYQSTQNSGGYYHLSQSYWANGVPYQLGNNIPGLPMFTYGVDAEGRPNSATASAGQNPVPTNGVGFNVFSQPTSVTLGSLDQDIFGYDANTGRLTQYQFKIGATPQSVTGTLTWNDNSTLKQLAIADPFNSANNQICTYAYDDVVRIASANCGGVASQTFTYDPFGNINKAGSPYSFNAAYSTSTNHITSIAAFTPTYDGNGNITSDGLHSYTWDVEARPVVMDGTNVTYDALNRMVEQNRSGVYTQIVYSPTGQKLALMSAQTLQKAFIPLPGGATAVYTSSGLDHYRHPDWLGSARLTSSPSQTVLSSVAYAPFGEPYAQFGPADLSFTGQNQDTTGGAYDFLAREYGIQGRWPSPDPLGIGAADLSDPQSLNLYAYARNNPLLYTDPFGLDYNICMTGFGCTIVPDWGSLLGAVMAAGAVINGDPDNGTIMIYQQQIYQTIGWYKYFEGAPTHAPKDPPGPPTNGPSIGPQPTPAPPTMRAQDNWWYTKQADCVGGGIKEFFGGLVLKKEIDSFVDLAMGDTDAIPGMLTWGTVSTGAEVGLHHVAENRPLIRSVRTALREEGWKVSGNALARGAKFLVKAAFAAHVGFALNDARETYNACREN